MVPTTDTCQPGPAGLGETEVMDRDVFTVADACTVETKAAEMMLKKMSIMKMVESRFLFKGLLSCTYTYESGKAAFI